MESERVFPQTDAEVDAAIQQEKDDHKRIQEQVKMSENDPVVERKEGEPETSTTANVKPTHLKVSVAEDDDCDVCDEEAASGSDSDPKSSPDRKEAKRKHDKKPTRKCQECGSVLHPRKDLCCYICKDPFVCEKCCGAGGFTGDACSSCEGTNDDLPMFKPKRIKKDKPARLGTIRPVITERRRRVFHPAVHVLEVNGLSYPLQHADTPKERFVKEGVVVRLHTADRKHETRGVSSKCKRVEVSVYSTLMQHPIALELEGERLPEGMSFVNREHNVSVLFVKGAKDMMYPVEVHVPVGLLHADDPAVATSSL